MFIGFDVNDIFLNILNMVWKVSYFYKLVGNMLFYFYFDLLNCVNFYDWIEIYKIKKDFVFKIIWILNFWGVCNWKSLFWVFCLKLKILDIN